jgi:hypothetical protein
LTERVRFHFDPICPFAYQTSRWARRLEELGEIELDWGVFSLEIVNRDNEAGAEESRRKGHEVLPGRGGAERGLEGDR